MRHKKSRIQSKDEAKKKRFLSSISYNTYDLVSLNSVLICLTMGQTVFKLIDLVYIPLTTFDSHKADES